MAVALKKLGHDEQLGLVEQDPATRAPLAAIERAVELTTERRGRARGQA